MFRKFEDTDPDPDKKSKGGRSGGDVVFVTADTTPSNIFAETPGGTFKELEELDRLLAEMEVNRTQKKEIIEIGLGTSQDRTEIIESKKLVVMTETKIQQETIRTDSESIKPQITNGSGKKSDAHPPGYQNGNAAVTTSGKLVSDSHLSQYIRKPGFSIDASGQVVNSSSGVTMSIQEAIQKRIIELEDVLPESEHSDVCIFLFFSIFKYYFLHTVIICTWKTT